MRRLFQFPRRSRGIIRTDVDDELRFHLESRMQELTASGIDEDTARMRALREFGDVDDTRRYLQAIDHDIEHLRRRKDYMNDLRQDLRYCWRSMRSSPAFTLVAVLTLALGIGANTAIFSVVHGVLQRSLPFPHPEQLVRVWAANPATNRLHTPVSAVDLDDWRAQRTQFADIGGYWYAEGASGIDLTGAGEPQRLSATFIEPGFFRALAMPPFAGRLPDEREMVRGGPDKVVVLAYGFWQRKYGGSTDIVGTSITLGGEAYQVLGVMPPAFVYPAPSVDVYVPFSTIPDQATPRIRPVRILDLVARLKPGVSIAQGASDLSAITGRLAKQFPEDASFPSVNVEPLRDAMTGSVKAPLLVLLAAVSFVLLMACVNVASLQLARASAREREMAVRASLGASRSRIVRQLVTESLALAITGGGLGLVLAVVGTRVLLTLSAGQLPRSEDVHVDGTVLAFALGVSLVSGILFGLAPAVRASAGNLQAMLRNNSGGAVGSGQRLRNALVITQIAFAVVLAVGAGLMTRSFSHLLRVDPGFVPDHLLAVNFTINTDRHGGGNAWRNYYRDVIDRVRTIPGVTSAGAAQYAPFRGMGERNGFVPPGVVLRASDEAPSVPTQRISDGYFRTIGTRIVAGREFTPADRDSTPMVVVVNEAFVRAYFPSGKVVGEQLGFGGARRGEIVGVVADIRQSAINEPAPPLMYISNMQNGRVKVTLVLRTKGEPLALTQTVLRTIRELDRDQAITNVFTFDDVMSEAVARPRLLTALFTAFGAIGLLLGAIGIYGVLAFLVNQRRREIGLRLALGASTGLVLRLIIRRGVLLALSGVTIGVLAALGLSRYMDTLLYGVEPTDPSTYMVVALALLGVAALASLLPARRAAGVDPMVALQQD